MASAPLLSAEAVRRIAMEACLACGASTAVANSLIGATLAAECVGRPEVGFAHLPDYLDGLRKGRIDGSVEPAIACPLPAFVQVDARNGIAQYGFDCAFDVLTDAVRRHGIALLTLRDSYTAGELGYYVRRLASKGFVAMAGANAHAMLAVAPGHDPAYGTNPLAFGAPLPDPMPPLVFDQSSSATAFVNIARAAARGEPIPLGWAIDERGEATTDAAAAVLGALLPAGGIRGANLALMIEILSAGLAGARWSLDAGHFREGTTPPAIGLFVIAIHAEAVLPGFARRLAEQVDRLSKKGVHIPGQRVIAAEELKIPAATMDAIRAQTI